MVTGALSLRAIARALGGEVSGGQAVVPGPGHSRRDRSLSIRLSASAPEGFLAFSHAGDDWRACRDYVGERLGLPRDGSTRNRAPSQTPRPSSKATSGGGEAERLKLALDIFARAVDAHATPVETYLNARKLKLPPGDDVIRFHSRCVFGPGERVPCMVTLFRHNLTNAPVGVQRTRLPPRGWARGMKMERLNLGPTSSGSIKIDDDADVLYGLALAEGTETALAGRALGYRPTWATGGKGTIRRFPVLPEPVQSLSVHWERDAADDVGRCLDRWRAAGRETIILRSLLGKDAADALWEGP